MFVLRICYHIVKPHFTAVGISRYMLNKPKGHQPRVLAL